MELKDKVAIITGSAKGIGFAIARTFAREGASIVLVDREGAENAAISLRKDHPDVMPIAIDITDMDAVNNAVETIIKAKGHIDILVNNAGIIARGSILDLNRKQWLQVMDVNVNGNFYFCKAVIPYMIRQHSGNIVNITSIAGKMGDITAAPVYGTSKGAINAFTKSLARQLAEYGIRVNAVAPHAIETDMSADWTEEKRKEVTKSIPLKRMGKPEEVAEAALFLASDRSSFITGEILDVNGGMLMD
ncbi:MAG TPA: SDR family NAD(P)-dependent oxidoreductase [Spirochaetales bacterium]|nr:SDR family oxidoreductase [Spirochaetales bacterium]HOV38762.1 SDR family NAD(P)-dependent oxidoreductase [Spirochaetales bacterium]